MFDNLSEDTNPSLTKFEQMLKTNQVLFFDALEFENIIHHYIDFAQFNLAKKAIKMGMEQHPQNVELMLLKSEILLFDGAHKQAEDLLVEIERISPEHEEIFLQRANISSKKKDHPKAIQLLEKALGVTEEPTEIWNLLVYGIPLLGGLHQSQRLLLQMCKRKCTDLPNHFIIYCILMSNWAKT